MRQRDGAARRLSADQAPNRRDKAGPHEDTGFPRLARRSLPGLLLHTIQLCIHCRQSPAGFWVSGNGGMPARRPWSLPCCQGPDPGRYHVIPFAGPADAGLVR